MENLNSILDSLVSPLQTHIKAMGITQLTPVQEQCFAPTVDGRDILGQSQTGSGKTLAFVLPLLTKLLNEKQSRVLKALILVPTRELATQVSEVITQLIKGTDLRVATVIGGDSYAKQISSLRSGAQIVVGTPGRVTDLEQRKAVRFDELQYFVLDEVDQMLDIGFAEDIELLHKLIPHKVQTLFFSATMSARIKALAHKMVDDPVTVKVTNTLSEPKIEHKFFCIKEGAAIQALVNALAFEEPEQALIFCETKAECDHVSQLLNSNGFPTAALHSDLSQFQRSQTLDRFRTKVLRYLVATNVAARGIDIKELPLVVNVAVPFQVESYVHRTGRTGRAGASGLAWTFVSPRRMRSFKFLLKDAKVQASEQKVPSPGEIKKRRLDRALESIVNTPIKVDVSIENDVEKVVSGLDTAQLAQALKNVLLKNIAEVRAYDVKSIEDTGSKSSSQNGRPEGRSRDGRSGERRGREDRRGQDRKSRKSFGGDWKKSSASGDKGKKFGDKPKYQHSKSKPQNSKK